MTETRNAGEHADLDLRSTDELVELMNAAGRDRAGRRRGRGRARSPPRSTRSSARLHGGGRLIYVGAGTSGRLAELDAAGVRGDLLCAARPGASLIAGRRRRLAARARGRRGRRGRRASATLEALGVSAADAVVAISASGRTPYVLGALARGRRGRAR